MRTTGDPDHEFGFELRVCRWAERGWPPDRERSGPIVVARQLGTQDRRWDTVIIEADSAGLRQRAAFGAEPLDTDLLHVVRNAPAEFAWYRDALPDPGYPWRYVREAIHRADDRDVVETRRDGNRIQIRRIAPYPDWVDRVIAIENKPDLDASAAADLRNQLERDVARGLADEVWVATKATGRRVEPMLLEALPDAAGVLTLDFDRADPAAIDWFPRQLDVEGSGIAVRDRSEWAVRFEYVDATATRETRLAIAERAYGRGWRSYVDTMRPDCASFDLRRATFGANGTASALVPFCTAKGREQTAGECSAACESCAPEPPAWRQHGWPIDGGPGRRARLLLETRRRRRRPGLDES